MMTRRGRFTHAVRPLDLAGPATLDAEGGTALVFCREGSIAAGGDVLGPGDAVLFEGALEIAAPGDGAATGLVVDGSAVAVPIAAHAASGTLMTCTPRAWRGSGPVGPYRLAHRHVGGPRP